MTNNKILSYYFTKYHYAEQIIETKKIKVATFENLNDPFECFCHNLFPMRNELREYLEMFKANNGFICFSKQSTEPLMWAHYAENYKGVCLGFEVPTNDLLSIDYGSLIVPQAKSKNSITLDDYIKTKYIKWDYEQEQRFVVNISICEKDSNGLYFFDFSEKWIISEIYLGIRNSDKLEELKSLCQSHLNINSGKVVQTDLSITDFKIKKKILP